MADHRRDALRPATLAEFAGQPDVARELGIILGAARARGELCDHLLFAGPPGLGKTTLAHIVAAELGAPLVTTSGPAIERPGDVATLLTGLPERSVVFVDEVHRLPRVAEELLYSAMEDRCLDVIVGDGPKARSLRLPLNPFVLVGATTQEGLLSGPLRDRFGFTLRLRLYSDEALAGIVARSAELLGVRLTGGAAAAIAARSRGTPRLANRWLRRVRDWAQTEGRDVVDADAAVDALGAFGVDALGLDQLGRDILTALCVRFGGGPVGLNTLAASVGETPTTLEEVYEPYLMRRGLLARTPRGRVATADGFAHLGLPAPPAALLGGGAATLGLDTAG